jgi:hypothetical protein
MDSTPRLYDPLVHVLSHHRNGLDRRQLKTLAWMVVGLLESKGSSLTAWAPYVHSRAVFAQSPGRRVARWRQHPRIDVQSRSGPLIQQAMAEWGQNVWSLALDTSRVWATSCLGRLALLARGRAIPLVWPGLHHPSRSVAEAADSA